MNNYKFYFLVIFFLLVYSTSTVFAQLKKDTVEASKLNRKADSLYTIDAFENAISSYDNAAKIYEKYSLWKAYYFNQVRISECYSRQGLYDITLLHVNKHMERLGERKLLNTETEALLLNQSGFVQLNKGRNDLALDNFKKAIDILTSLKQSNKANMALCYTNLGLANWNAGNNELALEHLQNALDIKISVYGPNHPEVADAFNNIGLIYATNSPEKALEYYTKAQKIYEANYSPNHSKVTNTLTNIAIIQRKQKMYDQALVNFQKILNSWATEKIKHPKEGFVYSNVGQVYVDKGELEKAVELKNKALIHYKEIYGEKHPEIANIYNQIGSIYSDQEKLKLALQQYQLAICANSIEFNSKELKDNPIIGNYYNATTLLQSLQLKARTLEQWYTTKSLKVGDLKIALNTFHSCDTLIERIRKVQTNKNDKIELGKLAAGIYEDAIRICMTIKDGSSSKKKYDKMAFYFSEKSKTAVLLEAISDAEAKHFASIPDSILERENFIKSEISFYEQKLAEKSDSLKEGIYREKLFLLNRQYESFISSMEKQFPEYYNLKYNIKSTSVESIQKIIEEGTALVSYFIADESKRVYVFYITKKKYKVYDVPENNRLNKLIIGYRNSIKVDAKDIFIETSSALYEQLIPFKVRASLKKIVIVPDGKVGTIPFEALLTQKISSKKGTYSSYPYLIKKCAIAYSYSANLYEQSIQQPARADGDMFLCAPVDFSGYTKTTLNDLPATEEEVGSIKKMFSENGISCNSYTGKNVQESLLKSEKLEDYKFLHFATHGIVDEINPELSEIYLAPDTTKKEDGNLYSGEIYNLKINADLVTLSACQTGLGKIQKGEGIIGLTRALLYAGAKNLVVSLWSVADKSTSMLMIDFYTQLLKDKKSNDYINSLRDSKLNMISQEQFNRPYYWAPFILIGK